MTGALAARGSTEGFTLDWRHEQARASSYRRQVGTTLFDADANVCLWHLADIDAGAGHVRFWGKADIPMRDLRSAFDPKRTSFGLVLLRESCPHLIAAGMQHKCSMSPKNNN